MGKLLRTGKILLLTLLIVGTLVPPLMRVL